MNTLNQNFSNEAKTALINLVDALLEYDGFSGTFGEVNTTIIDDLKDIGGLEMNGELIATYVYGGREIYVTTINEDLLYEATTTCLEIL